MNLKKTDIICDILLGIFAFLMIAMGITKIPTFGYAAIAVYILHGILHIIFYRCPSCKKYIGRRSKYCPNCGEKLEE